MNEKLQYASMLEIPVQSCNITYKPIKKKSKKKKVAPDDVKEQLLTKINSSEQELDEQQFVQNENYADDSDIQEVNEQDVENVTRSYREKGKRKFRFSAITLQLVIIGALIATIFITNSVYPNSGLNVFMRGVFGSQQVEEVDERVYSDFAPVVNADGDVSLTGGVMTISGEGSVYSTVNGEVLSVVQDEDGTYSMEIAHSEKFSSLFSGLTHVYLGVGDAVYNTIPVGYVEDSVDMCFKDGDGAIISDFEIVDDTVVWAV